MKTMILALVVLSWPATADAKPKEWVLAGSTTTPELAAFFVDLNSVSQTGEFRGGDLKIMTERGALNGRATVSCKTFYSWVAGMDPYVPVRGSAVWNVARILCGSDGPTEGPR